MIKHPLVQKEWKSTRWVMLLFSFVYIIFAVILNNNITRMKKRYLVAGLMDVSFIDEIYRMSAFMLPLMLIGITLLVILLFSQERNPNVGKFISTLPFDRKEQFWIKYVMGLKTFTIPFIVFGVVTIIMRVRNTRWISHVYNYSQHGETLSKQDSLGALLLWLGIGWLIMVAAYSFLMLIQTLMGQNIIAGVVGAIIYLVPWFLIYAVPAVMLLILGKSPRVWIYIPIKHAFRLFFLASPMAGLNNVATNNRSFYGDPWQYYRTYMYPHLALYIGILIILAVLSTVLAYYFVQGNDVEKNGELIMYRWFGKILTAGVSVCALLLLPIIVSIFTGVQSIVLTWVLMAIGGILGYVISHKSIIMTQKHG